MTAGGQASACKHPLNSQVFIPNAVQTTHHWCQQCGSIGRPLADYTIEWQPPIVVGAHDRWLARVKLLEERAESAKVVLDGRQSGVAMACTKPPAGWRCTRPHDHSGPCAAWPAEAPP